MFFNRRRQISLDRVLFILTLLLGRMRGIGVVLSFLWAIEAGKLLELAVDALFLRPIFVLGEENATAASPFLDLLRLDLDPVTALAPNEGDLFCRPVERRLVGGVSCICTIVLSHSTEN